MIEPTPAIEPTLLGINLAMVRNCFAWHYKEYQGEQSATDRYSYSQAEAVARNAHCGLWQDPNPIEPSE
jgi:endonuclease YncB( thermonuclease family)